LKTPKVYVIIVNYNGWADTIECLESILQSSYANYQVLVIDNCSTDNSLERIAAWAKGDLDVYTLPGNALRGFSCPPVPKPVPWVMMSRAEAESGHEGTWLHSSKKIVLVQAGDNLGFAGGTNIGMRFALSLPDLGYIWILNNDTAIGRDALADLVQSATNDPYDRPAGSVIYEYRQPSLLQIYGGLKIRKHFVLRPTFAGMNERFHFISGASIFLSRRCLEELGLIDEQYFLNSEDLAYTYFYQERFLKFNPGTDPFRVAGKIWHKGAASQERNAFLHAYYFTRNTLYASRMISLTSLALTLVYAFIRAGGRLLTGRTEKARGIFFGIRDYVMGRSGKYREQPLSA